MYEGLTRLEGAYQQIQRKIAIWVTNDPQFVISDKINATEVLNYIPRWPLILNLFGACFCMGASAIYHLF